MLFVVEVKELGMNAVVHPNKYFKHRSDAIKFADDWWDDCHIDEKEDLRISVLKVKSKESFEGQRTFKRIIKNY